MEDSLKGLLVALTVIGLFITAVLNFIVLFPQEQGATFVGQDANDYALMQSTSNVSVEVTLNSLNNQSNNAFNEWDVTEGFMGTNQLKQGQSGLKDYSTSTFSTLRVLATQLFGMNSPIVYAIGVFALLTTGYITYLIIKFVRTGN